MTTRTLFIGDVHGCSRELEKLLKKVRPTRTILVGDLFTRGPDPRGVFHLIERYGCEAVLGNHDEQVLQDWTPGHQLPKRAFRWLKACPHLIRGKGFYAVHAGVNPKAPKRTTREEALSMKHWGKGRKRSPWWNQYQGKRLVVHGHHARQGLADRRPYVLGLDTGCVAGGRLSGYVLERDKIVSVRAKRAYRA